MSHPPVTTYIKCLSLFLFRFLARFLGGEGKENITTVEGIHFTPIPFFCPSPSMEGARDEDRKEYRILKKDEAKKRRLTHLKANLNKCKFVSLFLNLNMETL